MCQKRKPGRIFPKLAAPIASPMLSLGSRGSSMKKHAAAAGLMAVAVVLSAAAAAVAKSAALLLQRTVPLPASSLETLQNLDKKRFASRTSVPDFDLVGMPG